MQSAKILSKESSNGDASATIAFIDIKSAAKAHNSENKIDDRLLKTNYYEPPASSHGSSAIYIHESRDLCTDTSKLASSSSSVPSASAGNVSTNTSASLINSGTLNSNSLSSSNNGNTSNNNNNSGSTTSSINRSTLSRHSVQHSR